MAPCFWETFPDLLMSSPAEMLAMYFDRHIQGTCLVYVDYRALCHGVGISRRGGNLLVREGIACFSRKSGFYPKVKREPQMGLKQGIDTAYLLLGRALWKDTVVSPYPQEICAKTPSEYMKLQII